MTIVSEKYICPDGVTNPRRTAVLFRNCRLKSIATISFGSLIAGTTGKLIVTAPLILTLLTSCTSAPQDLYLIVVMGQSNAVGHGEMSDLPPGFPRNHTKLWNFTNSYRWDRAREPIDSSESQIDLVSLDKHAGVGPSLAMADAYVSSHPTTSVGLIPCAKDGSSVSEWQKVKTNQPRKTLFGSCMTRIKTVSPASGSIRAVVFWQGGADAKGPRNEALKWKDRFTAFVTDLRKELGKPNLPIILVMLGTPEAKALYRYPFWQVVREQQHAVDIPGVIKVEADGYERQKDGVHFTTDGQMAFGAALARLLPAP